MTANDLITAVVGCVAIVAFLGTGTVFVLRGKQDSRIELLEKSNETLRQQASDLRNDVSDRDTRIEFLEHENELKSNELLDMRSHIAALEKLKLGEAYFQAMHDQVAAHSATVLANHEKILAEMATLRGQHRDILALLADQRRAKEL